MKKIGIFIFMSFLLFACAEQDRDVTIINQEASIDKYLESLSNNFEVISESGSNRVIIEEGNGEVAAVGDSVYFYYAGYIFNSGKGNLFATNNKSVADKAEFTLINGVEGKVVGGDDLIKGLSKGLIGVKQGEQCNVIFSAKYGYDNESVYNVPKLSPLFFDIWIERVVKN